MSKKIIWFSQHEPIDKQLEELRKIFGDVSIEVHPKPFVNAKEVVKIYEKMKGDEMVVVAPLSVIQHLLKLGIRPLFAEMEQTNGSDYDVIAKGRKFIFKNFSRITGIDIKKESL